MRESISPKPLLPGEKCMFARDSCFLRKARSGFCFPRLHCSFTCGADTVWRISPFAPVQPCGQADSRVSVTRSIRVFSGRNLCSAERSYWRSRELSSCYASSSATFRTVVSHSSTVTCAPLRVPSPLSRTVRSHTQTSIFYIRLPATTVKLTVLILLDITSHHLA